MKKIKIKDEMFNENIEIWIGLGKEIIEMANTFGETLADGKYFFGKKEVDNKTEIKHIIWLRDFNWDIHHQAMLLHELLHMVYYILQGLGFTLHASSEEIYTYYPQKLYGQIIYKLNKSKCLKKKKK